MNGRLSRFRWLDLEGLESRTLLATTPAASAVGAAVNLSGLSSVTTGGNANSPAVVIDPYNPDKVVAVWSVDLSSVTPVPHTTSIVEGAYSNDGGVTWQNLGENVAPLMLDVATVDSNPPTAYTQVTDPTVGFDSQDNFYVLSLETSGANDGALELTKFNFSGPAPSRVGLPNNGIIYQWVTGSDAATDPTLAVDASPPSGTASPDPHANNVYIAWSSIDTEPANPNPFAGPGFSPNRAELAVGTPIASPSGDESTLAFSAVQTVSVNGNFGPADNSHPQLVIDQNMGGQVTLAWDDFGSGAKASPPFDELMSSLVQPGDSFGFNGQTGSIAPATTTTVNGTTTTNPVTSQFTDSVSIPLNELPDLDDLSVTIALTDQESVQNLNLTLVAPNGDQITLVNNQNNAAGTANTGTGLATGNAIGVFGFTTGQTGTPGIPVGTVFDGNATRNIFDSTTTGTNGNSATNYIGTFRPEFGSLAGFIDQLVQEFQETGLNFINGPWTLDVTNFTATLQTNVPNQGQVEAFGLHFSTGLSSSSPSLIATTEVTGALGNTFANKPPSAPNTGVGPGLVMAIDNTLGSFSPFQGRIYAAYVIYEPFKDVNGHVNPTSNTDIELAVSDNGGLSWTDMGVVNDDNSDVDGYSGADVDTGTFGRTQFQPEVAVDQVTGTLVVSWRDARDDAANARVATYLTTSIDGGNSFSPQTYANPAQTATDDITGATDILGPAPDNESSGNTQVDATFGYGDQMGLAVFDGQVYPVWAGNFNQSSYVNGAVVGDPLNIWYRPMVIAAGPRITDSTMGPITLAEAAGQNITITVDFDRPVSMSTFVGQDAQVFYDSTSGTSNFVQLTVTGVAPVGGTNTGPDPNAYTEFLVFFDPLPNGANPATYNYTGTYSYLIAPDAVVSGQDIAISSPVESFVGRTLRPDDPMDQNADGTPDQNPLTMPNGFIGSTPGDIYAVPAPAPTVTSTTFEGFIETGSQVVEVFSSLTGLGVGDLVTGDGIPTGTTIIAVDAFDFTITLSAPATSNEFEDLVATSGALFERAAYTGGPNLGGYILSPPFNQQTLPIIVPGPQVVATSIPGGDAASGNLVTGGTASTLYVTFDRPMQVSTFTPAQVNQIMGPVGPITGPQEFASTSTTGTAIDGATSSTVPYTTTSTITIPSYDGTFTIAHISVSLTAAFSQDSALTAVLIAPDGTQVTLFSGVGGNGANFINTVLDDSATSPIGSGTAPFTGSFQPAQPLSSLDGLTVDMPAASNPSVWLPGVWTLQLTNTATGASGVLDSWALNITPAITVAPVNEDTTTSTATMFAIGFPQQQLSGTYTIQFGPNILDAFGDALDTVQSAGLQVLRGLANNGPTISALYTASGLPMTLPAPSNMTPSSVSSTINVPDSFIIEGDKTAAGASVMQVQLSLTYPDDPDLTATLTHFGPGGTNLGTVTLFSGVGAGSSTANFDSTVFDDNAATPIQNAGAPFFATYSPQQSLATVFAPGPDGVNVQGTWVLTITNNNLTTANTGKLTAWSLAFQKPVPTSGLGEPGSDDYTASFRIFTLAPSDSLSSQEWTPVGPASIGGGSSGNSADPSGRVTGLAIDPSDPSGNTFYAAGASGGVWKTTDFLTTAAAGPTWIPLTNFGPTNGVNIGGIAIFPRNNNPNDSIIIAATGEGDTGSPGVGFLISEDGGATWNLADSTDNVDASGNFLPINSTGRDRVFVGDTSFNVVVDPEPTPGGGVIIYAAMSGPTGGIWRSENTGATWTQVLAGQATDVALDLDSGTTLDPVTGTYVQGNDQIVYAAIRGTGVFLSPNQGQVWNEMLGGIGNPLIFNTVTAPYKNVNATNGPTPNGGQGRITLAVPTPTGNSAEDDVYSGWLYALVANPEGALFGIFVTKDFGQNWTEVNIPTEPNEGYQTNPAIPTNDVGLSNYSVIGSTQFPQGNYNQAMAVDPTDPNVIYVGGTADGNQSALIRINLTDIWDAHALVATSSDANDGGKLTLSSTGPATISNLNDALDPTSYLNFIRNPGDPFETDATVDVFNYGLFTNNGAGVEWIPLASGGTDYHRMVTEIDPTTGLPRIIFGDDQGIWSLLDNNGTPVYTIGTSDALAPNSRNGNLQITQFYYGAAQPSSAAALIAGALFYGSAQDNGGPFSDPDVVNNGDIVWTGPGGDASGVAADQQGNGTVYQYFWPCCGGNDTDFFTVNGVGETNGLLQASGGDPTPDPQWPYLGGANFAVNPVNGQDVVISSAVGRIFTTTNQGVNWFDIGDPAVFNSPGTFSNALAYGAPDPSAPSGVGNLGYFIYVGTGKGQIFVTQDGGGSGTSNDWINISTGLDGSPVQQIITDPTRGSHDAYAVTDEGVYFIANSIPSTSNPTPTWVNITGNLKTLAFSIFGQSYTPGTYNLAVTLSSIAADWRYAIPNSQTKGTNPVLYVGANSGVFQSTNNGQTWTLFPDTSYGAVAAGGYLPHVSITSLSLSLGDIDPDTGRPTLAGPDAPPASVSGNVTQNSMLVTGVSTPPALAVGDLVTGTGIPAGTTITAINTETDTVTLSAAATATQSGETIGYIVPNSNADPDLLMASSYGQGSFAINLAPLIIGNAVTVSGTTAPVAPSPLQVVTGPINITGTSEITGFGNATWITVEDVTDPGNPVVVAGFNPADPIPTPNSSNSTDGLGHFSIPFNPELYYKTNGIKTIEIFATDNAGAVGNVVTYSFNLNPPVQLAFQSPGGEPPSSALAGADFAAMPPEPNNVIVDVEDANGNITPNFNGPVTLTLESGQTGTFVGTLMVNAVAGVATFTDLEIDTAGNYNLVATNPNLTSGTSSQIMISPAAPKLFTWTTEPTSPITEGFPFGGELQIKDQFGNLESGDNEDVTVSLDLDGNPDPTDLGGLTTVAASGGVVTFSNIIINNIGDLFTLTATTATSGLTATSTDIDVVPPVLVSGSATSITATAGVGFPLTWTAETNTGAVDTAFDGTVTLSILSGPAGAAPLVNISATAMNGVASFSSVILDTAGSYVIQASSGNLTPGDTSVTVVAAAASGLFIETEPPSSVQAGASFGLVVGAEDQFDNPTTFTGNVSIKILNNPGGSILGGTAIATFSGGLATFSGLTLNKFGMGYTLEATSSPLSSATTGGIDVTPAPATQLVITPSGEPTPSTVFAGQFFTMLVDAEDQFGNIDTNFDGSVQITTPSMLAGTTATAASGVATFSDLAIDTAGTYQIESTATGVTSVTSSNVIVVANPTATQLVWAPDPPGQVAHGVGFTAGIDVEDQFGNIETTYEGSVSISLHIDPTGATLGGITMVPASNGVASFSGLTISEVGTGYTLIATGDGLTSQDSTSINVTPIPPATLQVTTQPPSTVQVNQSPGFGFEVDVLDQAGVPDPDYNGNVTVIIVASSGTNTLSGTKTIPAKAGIADFTGLSLADVGTVTLQVSTAGVTSITTNSIDVTAGPATQLLVVTNPPGSVVAGTAFGFEVEAEDQYGNLATSFNGSLTPALSSNAGNATLAGVVSTMASNGLAFFDDLAVKQAGTGYSIQVSGGNLSVTTGTFNVTAAAAQQLVFTSEPPANVAAGSPIDLSVSIADSFGNVVTSSNGAITIGLSNGPAGVVLQGSQTATTTNGVATFSGLTIFTAANGYALQAKSNGLGSATTSSFDVVSAAPAKLVVTVQPPSTMAAGNDFGLGIVAEDQYGNRATQFTGNVSIGLSNDPGGAPLIGGPFTVAAVAGMANFPAVSATITAAGTGYTLEAISTGLASVFTNSINVVAAAATQLVVQVEPPPSPIAGGSFGFAVAAEDPYGNINTAFDGNVTVAAPAGSGVSVTGSTTVTAAGGIATFGSVVVGATTSPVSLVVTSPGLTSTTTTPVQPSTAVLSFAVESLAVDENVGEASIQVVRSGGYQGAVSVQVATSGGTAVAGVNYVPISQTLTFAAGQDSQTVMIPIKNAGLLPSSTTVVVGLTGGGSGVIISNPSTVTVSILNVGASTLNGGQPTTPPVTLETVTPVKTRKRQITEIVLQFSGGLDAAEASNIAEYSLVQVGKHGSYTGKGSRSIKLTSAVYNPANDTVILTPKKRFVLKKSAELVVDGLPPSGLEDTSGRLIDGNGNGKAGSNAVSILTKKAATVSAVSAAVDQLVELEELAALIKPAKKS